MSRVFITKIGYVQLEVNENEPPKWEAKKNLPQVTASYDSYMKKQVFFLLSASVFL